MRVGSHEWSKSLVVEARQSFTSESGEAALTNTTSTSASGLWEVNFMGHSARGALPAAHRSSAQSPLTPDPADLPILWPRIGRSPRCSCSWPLCPMCATECWHSPFYGKAFSCIDRPHLLSSHRLTEVLAPGNGWYEHSDARFYLSTGSQVIWVYTLE